MSEKRREGDIHQRLTDAGKRIASSGFSVRDISPQLPEVVTNNNPSRWSFAEYRSVGLSISCVLLLGLLGVWFFLGSESTELDSAESSTHAPKIVTEGVAVEDAAEYPIIAELLAATFARKHQFRIPRENFAATNIGGNKDKHPDGWLAALTRKRQFKLSAISIGGQFKDQLALPKLQFHLSAP